MKRKNGMNRIRNLVLFVVLLCLLNGCKNNAFQKEYRIFENAYIAATDDIDLSSSIPSIKVLNEEAALLELGKMKDALTAMQEKARSDFEKEVYGYALSDYNGLIQLQQIAEKTEDLTDDEKHTLDMETLSIGAKRRIYKKQLDE